MADDINLLGPADLAYAEEIARKLYDAELDRRDKILQSMIVVSGPVSILIASIAFLANTAFASGSDYLERSSDVAVVLFYVLIVILVYSTARMLWQFHRLLITDFYHYLPDAEALLANFADTRRYCEALGNTAPDAVSALMRTNMVRLYADCATVNSRANDRRLIYRQGVFRNITTAILVVALAFIVIAIHRAEPHIWSVSSSIGSLFDGQPRASDQPPAPAPAAPGARAQ